MLNFSEMKVSAKLIGGFGLLIGMLVIIIVTAAFEFNAVGSQTDKIVQKDFAKALAAAKINELARSNAATTLQLLLTADKAERDKLHDAMNANAEKVASNFEILDKLVYSPSGKEILRKITERRTAYRESYLKVSKLIEDNSNDEALKLFKSETTPRLAETMASIEEFEEQQIKLVDSSGVEIGHDINSANFTMLFLGAIALIVGVGAALLITRSLIKQLGGEPSYAASIAETISRGDLTVQIDTASDDQSSLMYAIKKMRDSISEIVAQVRVATETIITSSTEISNGNMELSSRTEQQASSLEETAASMEELNQTVKQNADNARQANKLAQTASDVATRGGEGVAQVVSTMEAINASSKKIVDIISVIDGIAFQTNILALNAAVEAARAGEQGRGFAVVASEVRNLAQRSAAAAKEIKELISNSVEKVEGGTKLVGSTADTMAEVVNSIRQVNDIVSEITSASQEQSQGISQVNDAVIQMDDVTQQNAALVEQSAAASQSMQEQAHKLAELVSIFKLAQDGQIKRATVSARPTTIKSRSPATKRIETNAKPKVTPKTGGAQAAERKVGAENDKDWEEF